MKRELRAVGQVPTAELERLAHVADLETLEEVLRWGFAQRPGWDVVEVVVQDEFTHDVIVRGPTAVLLVFDTT